MIAPVLTALGVIDRLPVSAPVNEPVPNVIASALSSQPMNTLSELPLSITRPASFDGEPDVPFPSSINASAITELVEDTVVVVPLTVKSPDSVKFAN